MRFLKFSTLCALIFGALCFAPTQAHAAGAAAIDREARAALRDLYDNNAAARALGDKAVAILVFPGITKAGFVFAGQHGDGAMITPNGTTGFYNSVAASWGFQAGVQKFGYALFFMNSEALRHLHGEGGWEVGTTPSLVIVDRGMAASLSTTDLKRDIYGFIFDQKGLMGGIAIEGSKITKIHPPR